MTALDFKKRFLKQKELPKFVVVGHLSPVTEGERDHFYHINDDEAIPHNVGVSLSLKPGYADHRRDDIPWLGKVTLLN